jgi:hypothetical protein
MSENFLKFKKAFHQSAPSFPTLSNISFGKFTSYNYNIQHSKWMKLFSAGVIIYSAYCYLKRTSSNRSVIQHSFSYYLHNVKKLFSRSIANGSSREKETQKNIVLEVKELPEHVKYDGGWFDELDELKRSSSDEPFVFSDRDALLNPLRENTPRGDIIMYYCAETKSFNYYSNSKNIPYSTLDAVARKYVCLHKDPSIYIDIRDEVQKGREKCLKQDKDNKSKLAKLAKLEGNKNKNKSGNEILSSAKKSLFAAFKNYKTGRNNDDGKKEIVIMKDCINKFVYKGTLDQYDFDLNSHKNKKHSPPSLFKDEINNVNRYDCDENVENGENVEIVVTECKNQDQNLSYADFKKLNN